MERDQEEKGLFEKILAGFSRDGTHPDFPLKKIIPGAGPMFAGISSLIFDLPALVVYERGSEDEMPPIGIVFALHHGVDGVCIRVMSMYQGKITCHPIGEPPAGEKPAYLLVKNHSPMIYVP